MFYRRSSLVLDVLTKDIQAKNDSKKAKAAAANAAKKARRRLAEESDDDDDDEDEREVQRSSSLPGSPIKKARKRGTTYAGARARQRKRGEASTPEDVREV